MSVNAMATYIYIALGAFGALALTALLLLPARKRVHKQTRTLRHRNRQLAIVNRTLKLAGTSLDLDRILREATRGALDLTGFDYGVMCVHDPKVDHLRAVMRIDANRTHSVEKVLAADLTCPDELQELVANRLHAMLTGGQTGIAPLCARDTDPAITCQVLFPLRASGRITGLMCLYAGNAPTPDESDLELIAELSLAVALAIDNVRLYDQTRDQRHALEEQVEARTRQLAESSDFWQALIDHIPSPIFYKDTNLLFLGCNRAYEIAFGVARHEIIGKQVLDLDFIPVSHREMFQEEQARILTEGGTLQLEVEMPFSDGSLHQMLYSATSFKDRKGRPRGIVGVLADITSQKETEAELAVARDAAEAADRVKSAFLATMSHELRTPLNSIIGFTGILLQELAGPLNGEQARQLEMVRSSARHLLALINDVLDISRIEAGEIALRGDSFLLAESLDKVVGIARPLAEAQGLDLVTKFDDNPGRIEGDSRRVEQIVLNLISNAIKFTSKGSVSVTASRVETAGEPPHVRISVTDTGIGIRDSDLDELFTPFRQIDSRLSREHEGTGLGLAICKLLTQMMGGRLEVDSEWGKGSEFRVLLPVHPPSRPGNNGEPE